MQSHQLTVSLTASLSGVGVNPSSAMAALGLDTDLVKVKSLGWRPIALAMALWANLLGMGFLVSKFLVGVF